MHIFDNMKGIINIIGLIGYCDGKSGVNLVDVISQVKKQPEATSFDVIINSEGGNVFTGFEIYDYIKSLGVPVTTIGSGTVASIATVVFMAGDQRQVNQGTQFMIHLPWGTWSGTAEEMQDFAGEVKKQENRLIDFYATSLDLSKEAISPLLRNTTWLSEDQLMDLGFVNSKIMPIAAKVSINKTKQNMEKTKSETLLEKIWDVLSGKEKERTAIVAKMLYDANQGEVIFPNVADEDEVVVGEEATIGGANAEGSVVMADGRTFVFSEGVLTSIVEKEDEVDKEVQELTDLLEAKKLEVEALKIENIEIAAKLKAVKDENKTNKAIIDTIKAVKSEFEVDGKKDKPEIKEENKLSRITKAMQNRKK